MVTHPDPEPRAPGSHGGRDAVDSARPDIALGIHEGVPLVDDGALMRRGHGGHFHDPVGIVEAGGLYVEHAV